MIHVNHPQMDARYVYREEEYQYYFPTFDNIFHVYLIFTVIQIENYATEIIGDLK